MILDEFIKNSGLQERWKQHEQFLQEQQNQGIGGGVRSALGTIGVLAEGPTTVGKAGVATTEAAIGKAFPGFSDLTDRAYLGYVAAGGNSNGGAAGQQFGATIQGHEAAAHGNEKLQGLLDMAFDPTNVIPLGPAEKLQAVKKVRLADKAGAGAKLSEEFLARAADVPVGHGIASDIEEKLAVAALGFGDSGEKAASLLGKSATKAEKARVAAAKPAVRSIADAAKGFTGVGEEAAANFKQSRLLQDAGENLLLDANSSGTKSDNLASVMEEYARIKKQAASARELKADAPQVYRDYKGMQQGMMKSWQDEGMASGAAKAWFEEISVDIPKAREGLRNPQPGESWRQYVDDASQLSYHLNRAEDSLYQKVKAAYSAPEVSNLTQAQADALVGPEALQLAHQAEIGSPKYGQAVKESASAGLSNLNTQENAFFNSVTPKLSEEEAIATGLKDFAAKAPDPAQPMLDKFPGTTAGDWTASAAPQAANAYTPVEQKVLQLATDLGRTPTPGEVQRELKVGFNEAARLSDVASGKLPGTGAATAGSVVPQPSTPVAKWNKQLTTAPDSPPAIKEALDNAAQAAPLPTAPEAAALVTATPDGGGSYVGRMSEFVRFLAAETAAKQRDSFTRKGVGILGTAKAIPGVWSSMMVETTRNLLMDPIWNKVLLLHEGIGKKTYDEAGKVIVERLTVGEKNEVRLFGGIADTGGIHEWPELLSEKPVEEINSAWKKAIGGSAWELESEAATRLSALENMAASTVIGLANPVRGATNLLLAPLGLLTEARSHAFHIINSITHTAARSAAFESAYVPFMENSARRLLGAAKAEGLDITELAGQAMKSAGRDISMEGGFGPSQVLATLGERYANEWMSMIEQGRQAGFTETKRVFGDFANRGPAERAIGKFVPFMSWTWRAYPRMMQMVGEHPLLAATLYQLNRIDGAVAKKEQRKNYQYGTLAINKDTKLVGLLASVFTPEQEGEIRLNPLSLISPVGGEQLGIAAGEGDQPLAADAGLGEKVYRGVEDTLNTVGSGLNPALQALAYEMGWTYKSPSPGSRYASIDNLMSQFAPALDAPTVQGPMRGLRKMITGKSDNFDPVEAKAKELIFQRTGKPVNDASNRQLAAQLASHTGIYAEAQRVLDSGNAGRSLFNANSPVTVMTNTAAGEQVRKSKLGLPFTYDQIQQAQVGGLSGIAQYMANENERYKMANPAAYASETPATIKSR